MMLELGEINVFGTGAGPWHLTDRVMWLIMGCSSLMGDRRILEALEVREHQVRLPLAYGDQLGPAIEGAPKPLGILVSGDVGLFSLAQRVCGLFPHRVRLFPNVSSLQLMASRLKRSWANVPVISVHGRPPLEALELRRFLWGRPEGAVLLGRPQDVRETLLRLGELVRPDVTGHLGWDLGTPREQVFHGGLDQLAHLPYTGNLSILWLSAGPQGFFGEQSLSCLPPGPMDDSAFQRLQRVPMTKSPVRGLVTGLLQPLWGARILEVGTGTGALTCELARQAGPGVVVSIERDPEAMELARGNLERLGLALGVHLVGGSAPLGLRGTFDRIVIGGHGGALEDVIRWARDLLVPGGRVLVPCVLARSGPRALQALEEADLKCGMTRLFPTWGRPLGGDWMAEGMNPVDLVWGDLT